MAASDLVIVTGATGFVGRVLVARLGAKTFALRMSNADWVDRAAGAPFARATVVHLAARAHRQDGVKEADYMQDNAEMTRLLAGIAARKGAKRLVFLSSIKVNGEESGARPFAPADPSAPRDAYARSKLAAEESLQDVASRHGLEFCIVRSPLVYGKGAGGNLRALLRLVDSPWPLPFASLHARRSFIHVDDLASLLMACAAREEASGRTYLAAHREPTSTRDLVSALRRRLGRAQRLVACSPAALEAAAAIAGQSARMRRLTRALEVDPSAAELDLGWRAQLPIDRCVADLVEGYRQA